MSEFIAIRMVSDNVSDSEQLYITSGCDQSFRSDGRGCFDYREVNIENNILPHVGQYSSPFTL